MMPFTCETIYDLGYVLTRTRVIVFLIAFLFIAANIGVCITYLILFGDIMSHIVSTQLKIEKDNILNHRYPYVIGLSAIMTPLFFTKKIDQLTVVSIILTFAFSIGFCAFFI